MKKIRTKNVVDLIKKEVRELSPYSVEHIDAEIKLDAMENPYTLSQVLKNKIQSEIKKIHINRYPDPEAEALKKIISSVENVKIKNILIGNGSDELIQIIFTAVGSPGDKILIPIPTFSMYKIIAAPLNLRVVEVPLKIDDWEIDSDTFIRAIQENSPRIIILANPNNPTGNCFDETTIINILNNAPGMVVIDEAYYNFSLKTNLQLMEKYPNLIVLRTLSKIGMAGLRLGFMIADDRVVEEISKVRLPYNTNSFSQTIARVILENKEEIFSQIESIIKERDFLFEGLKKIKGIVPYISKTNFILFRSEMDSKIIYQGLIKKSILIRNFGNKDPLKNHLRVTVGTKNENSIFLKELSELIM